MLIHLLLAVLLEAPSVAVPDYIIQNVTIVDGSGAAAVRGSVAITGERISAIGTVAITGHPIIIDGTNLVVAPGFIDLHTHCDSRAFMSPGSKERFNKCYVTQGVTTVVTGNCGAGPTDVADYFARLEKNGVGTNVIHQIPHNSIRVLVMGNSNRVPTSAELLAMERLVDREMQHGCWGLSTGLIYTPGTFARTEEIIDLARVVAKHGGFYASHIRDEGTGLNKSIEETLRIGREAKLPVHVSHIKCSGRSAWGHASDAIQLILNARRDGYAITADQYPYIASSTSLAATVIPTRFRTGTAKEYRQRFEDEQTGPAIRKAVESALSRRKDGATIQIARYAPKPAWQGRTIAAIARLEGKNGTDIVLEIEKNGGAGIVNFGMNEEDIRLFMKQPFVATASDGSSQIPGDTVPHPRNYGTFPRKIGAYAIQDGIISLEFAIRSCSGLPADILKLTDRGYLKKGYFADLVVFDPKKFRDRATYDKPHQYSAGLVYLFMNGSMVINKGLYAECLPGKPIRHPEPSTD